jgi:hypothetical protein
MQKLKEADLYQSELVQVSGKLVDRYNECLVSLGFTPSELTSFSVDGIGWSPEVAKEKGDIHYLNNGEANSHGIIVTPKQKGLPIYVPFHSFDRELMKLVFKTYGNQIADITRDCAIYLDFDQKIDVFYEPLDVLKYQDVTIYFHLINDLDEAQKEQLKLIEYFERDDNFIDEEVHQKLLESAKKYGDLRGRNLELEELHYTTDSFYTRAFGGMYLLRDFTSPILVFEEEASYKEAIENRTKQISIYHVFDDELVDRLQSYSIVQYNLETVVQEPRYERIKKYMLAQHLEETNHPIQDILESKSLFKSYLNKIDLPSRKKVMGVEIYLDKRRHDPLIKMKDVIDEKLLYAMYLPHASLKPSHQDLVWKLLVNISPLDILFTYWYDKDEFYKKYNTWNDSMRDWVIETIRNNF